MNAVVSAPPGRTGSRIDSPEALRRLMQADHAPSEEQWAAITAPLAPVVVVAGAGSGKTTLMAARVVYLVATGQVRPEQVLGLTFTTKAAAELRTRVRRALVAAGLLEDRAPLAAGRDATEDPEEQLEPTVATYNSYAAGLLTEHGLRIGHEPETRVLTDASRYQLGARVVARHTGSVDHLSDHPPTVVQNLLALDGQLSEHLVGVERARAFDQEQRRLFEAAVAAELAGKARKTYVREPERAIHAIDRRAELLDLVASYRRLKGELGLMDFSDQIELGARLAREHAEVGALERERYRMVMLDEYQDTSVAQAWMLAALFSGPDDQHGLGHPVMAVGDPNQAIYGWRGASVSNILGFPDAFGGGHVEVPRLPLTVNRRSAGRILEVANALASPLHDAQPSVEPLRARPGAGEGVVRVRVFETLAEELAWVADAVRSAHDVRDGRWSDIGVLTRDNATAEAVFDALTAREVPVEIVGLSGLLRLPEVAEVVAVLTLLHDVSANPALLTVLSGPRWAIGPRDLALLRARAEELAGHRGRTDFDTVEAQLAAVADGVDPAELPALTDALDDPGDAPYSSSARERFALLSAELRALRSHAGEPVLDVVRRIVETIGVDVELASALSPAAAARRDNLDLFLKAVADFQSVDGEVTLAALLAYLTAEDEQGNGLDLAVPTEADSVKLLTVHRAKGLEWRSVFVVGMCETRFPSNRSRPLWVTSPSVLPAPLRGDAPDLPRLGGHDKPALDAYRAGTRTHEQGEELRLAYVALTRAAHELTLSSHLWAHRTTPFGPSDYQRVVADHLRALPEGPHEVVWLDRPDKGATNPVTGTEEVHLWPLTSVGIEARLRAEAARLVREVAAADGSDDPDNPEDPDDLVLRSQVAQWDEDIARLVEEVRSEGAARVEVALPPSLSATAMARLREDPEAFARDLVRPMPRQPSPAARFGTRFHAWVEARFGQQALLDPDELPGRGDLGIDDEDDLRQLVASFEAGPFGDRRPHAVEASFALVLAGQVVRGRIDAVYEDGDGFLVVDWKTNRAQTADPLQLALYRLAWAELSGVPPARVRAAFHYVRSGETVEPPDLLDRPALEQILTSGSPLGEG